MKEMTASPFEAIGFEGFAGDDVPLTFGAAALRGNDGRLWNAVTWTAGPLDDWDRFVEGRVVTPCPAHAIGSGVLRRPLFILRCSLASAAFPPVREWLASDPDSLAAWTDATWAYWLVPLRVMKPLAAHVLERAEAPDAADRESLRKQAYVLDHERDPLFQALLHGR